MSATHNRKTILLLIGQLSIGGAEHQCVNLAKSVDSSQYRVIVGVLSSALDLASELELHGIEVIVLRQGWHYSITHLPQLIGRIRNVIRSHHVHLIHTFLFPANVAGCLAALLTGVPVVLSDRSAMRSMPFLQRAAYAIVGRLCSVMTVNSFANRTLLIRQVGLSPQHIIVHWNGIDLQKIEQNVVVPAVLRQQLDIPSDTQIIGTICRVDQLKRLDLILEAAVRVRQRLPNVRFLIVGGPTSPAGEAYMHDLQQYCDMLELRETVIFTGAQSHPADYMRLLDLFLLTSLEEGTPNALLEAMALGCPALSTDVGDVAKIFAESQGGTILAPDPDLWAATILTLLADPVHRVAIGAAGQAYVRREFRLSRLAEQTQSLWASLLN